MDDAPAPLAPLTPLTPVQRAERAIIGAILSDTTAGDHFQAARGAGLGADDFAHPLHAAVWPVACDLRAQGRTVNTIVVEAALQDTGKLAAHPGYLDALIMEAPAHPLTTGEHAQDVRRASLWRQREQAAHDLPKRPHDRFLVERLQDLHRQEEAIGAAPRRRFLPAPEDVFTLWSTPRPPAVPTPFRDLTCKLGGGFIRGRNTLLIGATGRGKTGLAIQFTRHWLSAGWPVLYLSTELPRDEVYGRFLGQVLRRPWREVWEWGPSVAPDLRDRAAEHLSRLALIEYAPGESLSALVQSYRQEAGQTPIIVVDVAQDLATHAMRRIRGSDARAAARDVSAEAKAIAREHQTVVLLLSHTSRAISKDRDGNRVKTASDFEAGARDSGDWEQDAAVVLFLDSDDCPPGGTADARLHLSKVSGGGRGQTVGLRFHGALGLFEEDEAAALSPELRDAIDAIRGGATSTRALRQALGMSTDRMTAILRALVSRRLIIHNRHGIRLAE